MTAKY